MGEDGAAPSGRRVNAFFTDLLGTRLGHRGGQPAHLPMMISSAVPLPRTR